MGPVNYVISYYRNGKALGACYEIPATRREKGWFPAVSIRNVSVEFNFGGNSQAEFCPINDSNSEDGDIKVE